MGYTKAQRERAKKLLASKAWDGDHGFRGDALITWMKQKDLLIRYLTRVASGQNPRRLFSTGECPRSVARYQMGFTLPEGTEGNPGTRQGEEWVWSTKRLASYKARG
jgi:hypothetical protein